MTPFKADDKWYSKVNGKWYAERPITQPARVYKAEAGSPIDVEFETGRIDPLLKDYAHLVRKAYWQANHPFWTHDTPDLQGFAQNDADGEIDQIGECGVIVPQAHYDPSDSQGPSRAGAELIAKHTSTMPIDVGDRTTDPTKLIGPEIGANAVLICQRIKYRAAHLYDPMINAIVFGHTMAGIGRLFGGNTGDSAKLGREKVKDGLLFAKLVFDDLIRQEREDDRRPGKQRTPENQFALGPNAERLPVQWRLADNDNRRAISNVA